MLPFIDGEDNMGLPKPPGTHGEPSSGLIMSQLDLRGRSIKDVILDEASLHQPLFSGLKLQDANLTGTLLKHGRLDGLTLSNITGVGLHLLLCDGESLCIDGGDLSDSEWVGVNARDAALSNLKFERSHITLSHLFGSRWKQVNAAGSILSQVDLSFSTFEGVNFSGADLRGVCFRNSSFKSTDFSGSLCHGADFRGATGLSDSQRKQLAGDGAILRGSASERFLAEALSRLFPKASAERLDRSARLLTLGIQALTIIFAVLLTLALFWDRVTPPEGTVALDSDAPQARQQLTETEIRQSKESLKTLKEAIQAAYETSGRYGVATYPSIQDLGDNVFDRDGSGPGTDKVVLVEGGLPLNLLTGGEAILPYCNETPSQETISGEDSDWHYCEENGRLFACGGFTDLPTLSW